LQLFPFHLPRFHFAFWLSHSCLCILLMSSWA